MIKYKKYISLFLIATLLTGCSRDIPELIEPAKLRTEIIEVKKMDIEGIEVYNGKLVPSIEKISFTTSGTISDINAYIGQTVKKGDVLAKYNTKDIDETIRTCQNSINEIKKTADYNISLNNNRINYEKQLQENFNNAIAELRNSQTTTDDISTETNTDTSTETLEEIESTEEVTGVAAVGESDSSLVEEEIRELESQLAASRTQVSILECNNKNITDREAIDLKDLNVTLGDVQKEKQGSNIVAPCNGQIVATVNSSGGMLIGGDSINANDPIYYITNNEKPIYIYGVSGDGSNLDERFLRNYEEIYVEIDGIRHEIEIDKFTTQEIRSTLDYKGDKDSVLPTRFKLTDGQEGITLGSNVSIFVRNNVKKNVLGIPTNALIKEGTDYYVTILDGDNRRKVAVTIGAKTELFTEIVSGLEEGDKIVIDVGLNIDSLTLKSEISLENYSENITLESFGILYPNSYNITCTNSEARIKQIYVENGGEVKKGDKLVTLSLYDNKSTTLSITNQISSINEEYDKTVEEHNKTVSQLESDINNEMDSGKKKLLQYDLEYNNIEYEMAKYNKESQITSLNNELKSVKENSGEITLVAPISGVVKKVTNYSIDHTVPMGELLCYIEDYSYEIGIDLNGRLGRIGMNVEITNSDTGNVVDTGTVVWAPQTLLTGIYTGGESYDAQSMFVFSNSNLTECREDRKNVVKGVGVYRENVYCVDTNALFLDLGVYGEDNKKGEDTTNKKYYVYTVEGDKVEKRYITIGHLGKEKIWILQGIDKTSEVLLNKKE